MNKILITIIFLLSITPTVFASPVTQSFDPAFSELCLYNPELQALRSKELQQLMEEDQNDRMAVGDDYFSVTGEDWLKIDKNDLERRKRVGEIFAEGCFKTAADYHAAGLIYQHGDAPDQFYQTYIWAKRALELGDINGKSLMAVSIDRYLVSMGHKQLFGTQQGVFKTEEGVKCLCMEPVEASFPEELRPEYSYRSLKEQYDDISFSNEHTYNGKKVCPLVECPKTVEPSPKGTFPGFW